MRYYVPSQVSVTALLANFDTNLVIPAGKTIELANNTCTGTIFNGVMMSMSGGGV